MHSLLMAKLILLVLLTIPECLSLLNHYLKMPKTDAIGHDIGHVVCGDGW
jgi:hypothetical protein